MVRPRGFIGEGPTEKIRRRRSAREGPSEKAYQKGSVKEGLPEKVRQRRSDREDGCQKRGLTLKPTMTLIPCEIREEKNVFLY